MSCHNDVCAFLIKKDKPIVINEIYDVAVNNRKVYLDGDLLKWLKYGRSLLEKKLDKNEIIYGVNTGFGGNANMIVPAEIIAEHQNNLLRFLSAGTGPALPPEHVRAAQFLVLIAVSRGWSSICPETAQILAEHLNQGIIPIVPRYGSVGASGDLIPLTYIARALCGEGRVWYGGAELTALEAIEKANLLPIKLKAKEGLALINGTRMMTGISAIAVVRLEKTLKAGVAGIAMAIEALQASDEHFDARIQEIKKHPGQKAIAATLRQFLKGSQQKSLLSKLKQQLNVQSNNNVVTRLDSVVQEVYSIRCAPQILGIIPESLVYTKAIVEREAYSANDNPLIDPNTGDVLNGGNFMGHYIARTMDALKLDIALLANHLHSIVALMMDERFSHGLANSLSPVPGIYQGMKGIQLSQTALVAAIRRECSPSGIHTMPTEQYNQDIVSLGTHAAQDVVDMEIKLRDVVSITLITAAQGLTLRDNLPAIAPKVTEFYHSVRRFSPVLDKDRPLDEDIIRLSKAIIYDELPLPEIALD
ncbi:HAL/PAL/TAL family ammonia-lyase [Yersinia frederiksenii]|uniref:HAL/PAL/TAL family ammonia-lyase n=1 Tax=Yersinia frederiksenii TaxID=29484 RepID=UPI0005E9F4F3|nr:aromatic amino acid ammonia-lyase [Yersinia frederiksenii]CQH25164.1 putative phenylalanine and histidine ammonia-lyase [Yersinia frederiksenii]